MSKKQYILEKAEALFAEKGFDATSVRDIAKEARINIAMISYYFGSKAKLMEELFKMRMTAGLIHVKEISDDPDLNAIQKLEKSIMTYVGRVRENSKFYQVILAEQATNQNKGIIRFLNKSKENYVLFYEQLLHEGYKAGVFKNKVDGILFITTITGTLMQCLLNKQLYLAHYKMSGKEFSDEVYFERVGGYLKSIVKSILGYDHKN